MAQVLILVHSPYPEGRKKTSVGTALGWFGVKTHSLLNNHVTSLGYPSNHDNALIMHEVNSQFKRFRTPTNAEYPNDMIEGNYFFSLFGLPIGISGGPWIADFGSDREGGDDNNVVGMYFLRNVLTIRHLFLQRRRS